jgi:hypothetical protein
MKRGGKGAEKACWIKDLPSRLPVEGKVPAGTIPGHAATPILCAALEPCDIAGGIVAPGA